MTNVKITVIIPVYNTAKFLPECLDSVLTQDLTNIELICINDGSPDNALEILQEYAAKDARFHIIDKKNEGVGAARNDGIRAARGEFIAFMDSDDFYPHCQVLSRLYECAVDHQVSISGGRYLEVLADGQKTDTKYAYQTIQLNPSGVTKYRDFQFDYGYWAYIFRTALLRQTGIFFPTYSRFQDPPFFVQAMLAAESFYALAEPTYCYRMLPGAEKTSIGKTLDMLKGIMDNLRFSRQNNLARLHYISAGRLNEEGSYMAIRNLQDARNKELLAMLVQASALVDSEWLRKEGYQLPEPFVLDAFLYAANAAGKYEKLRNHKCIRWMRKTLRRCVATFSAK